ncbi:unnamed protein product [Schistosoma mattheei]|uniref:Uncharacterized protein n=1 Tax=Schistosoma mattheei TaxID=31246 RepID=A0A3P7YY51_9TREM|nr:unnamed protein product [Schistosoma mattheei]
MSSLTLFGNRCYNFCSFVRFMIMLFTTTRIHLIVSTMTTATCCYKMSYDEYN